MDDESGDSWELTERAMRVCDVLPLISEFVSVRDYKNKKSCMLYNLSCMSCFNSVNKIINLPHK